MKIKETVGYLMGADYLKKQGDQERQLFRANARTKSNKPSYSDVDFRTNVKIIGNQIITDFAWPIVLFSRVTGIDFGIKKVRKHLTKNKEPQ